MKRQVTPTQLALFSRSPVIGAWWEELNKIDGVTFFYTSFYDIIEDFEY